MTLQELQALIAQGEGPRLDFKRGVPSVKDLARTVVCLANAHGGKILLGVDDDGTIRGCPSYDVPDILAGIYRATDPPMTVDIEEVNMPQGTVLVIHVPRTPFIHSTTGGLFQLSERLYLPLPLLLRRLEELIEADNEVHSFLLGLQRIDVPAFPEPVYREAILNAVAHRNYGLPGNIIVRHFPDRLEVYSPGEFLAGVTPANILRQVVPRNRLLADVLGRVGYVERAGYGVDMMYEQMLRLGKEPPGSFPTS
ncbi:MAG: RNA-binding domain-containing protein [Anaerolineae bacterium]